MLIGILKNQNEDSTNKWEIACKNKSIDYVKIDLIKDDWLEQINESKADLFLHRPPGDLDRFKTLFDERVFIISNILKKRVFPSHLETLIYENKRMLSYFLNASSIPHPKTSVFYKRNEALEFSYKTELPIVVKSNIGAAGSGVHIFHKRKEIKQYTKKAFSRKGIQRRFGPNRAVGSPKKWFSKAISSPSLLRKKLKEYLQIYRDIQSGYVIFQEYIPHEFEWRIAKIGESYFGYKKMVVGEKASGAKKIVFENPPETLLDFVRDIAIKNAVYSAAFDVFIKENEYLINEVQTIFGHIHDHILEVNGIPGRYVYYNNQWVFEKGDFNANESYDLRLEAALKLYE